MRSDHLSKHVKTHNGNGTDGKKGSSSGSCSDSENSQSEPSVNASSNGPAVNSQPLGPPQNNPNHNQHMSGHEPQQHDGKVAKLWT
ncbi:unnamed protein product [Oppiella nova]|uniref:Uncharacterized protein n=1 Tax=Oppiella nova TaxID=334625 RepID=A0A7R9MT14_9ACAR|nr:unnamed protein product [Oppiella nova]CAD7665200.1 unnamed protein product [Oppiella nova]CAG2169875.1 unnamed protein product [Oppiella nova]CAG2182337.1 unnamed protein product [Oppiella nova]